VDPSAGVPRAGAVDGFPEIVKGLYRLSKWTYETIKMPKKISGSTTKKMGSPTAKCAMPAETNVSPNP
jgi:hypothetical protein